MVRSSYLFVNRFGVVIRPKATEKRNGEHDAFVKEQLDFDNAIAACHKAAEMLTEYYGDGKPKESTKPAWMTLM